MTKESAKKDLEKLTKPKLVEEAHKYPAIEGASGKSKEELIALIRAERAKLGEEAEESAPSAPKAVKPKKPGRKLPEKAELKAILKNLKEQRRQALENKDRVQLSRLRRRYKKVNRQLRRESGAAG